MKKLMTFLNTPARLIISGVVVVLAAEFLIRLQFSVFNDEKSLDIWDIVDPIMLAIFIYPAFYILFFRPMCYQQAELERQLAELRRNEQLTALIDAIPDAVFLKDGEGRWLIINELAKQMFQLQGLPWQGKTEMELADMQPAFRAAYEGCLEDDEKVWQSGQLSVSEESLAGEDGRCAIIETRKVPIFGNEGQRKGLVVIGRDITELDEQRKRIQQMAFYDSLTSLPNRTLFNDRLQQILADVSWHGRLAGVMMLDLDRFKMVNDALGHTAGDELLREAGGRIRSCVRGYDTVARLGGDEFAILLPEIRTGEDLGKVASEILESLNKPFMLKGGGVFVSSSIGIAVYPEDGSDAEDLMKYADSAMYFAKRCGRNNFRFYSKDLTDSANERLMLEGDLRRSFEQGELELYYQPKVNLADGLLAGSEALLRWNHPQRGMVPPDKFIPIAEDCGLIVEIGEWVLRCACRVACEWNSPDNPLHKVAINLSARQFQSGNLVNTVRNVLAETGCDPAWIELEITESLLLDEYGEVLEILAAFREMGITIAIDDFGTGYSSLSYIARFPIDTLKIDRSFITRLTEYGYHLELVKAIISIAKSLGQQVVAEGVETAEQAALLQTYGCQLAQGYFYGKPMPRQIFEDFAAVTTIS